MIRSFCGSTKKNREEEENKAAIKKKRKFVTLFTHFRLISPNVDFAPVKKNDVLVRTSILIYEKSHSGALLRTKEREDIDKLQ